MAMLLNFSCDGNTVLLNALWLKPLSNLSRAMRLVLLVQYKANSQVLVMDSNGEIMLAAFKQRLDAAHGCSSFDIGRTALLECSV